MKEINYSLISHVTQLSKDVVKSIYAELVSRIGDVLAAPCINTVHIKFGNNGTLIGDKFKIGFRFPNQVLLFQMFDLMLIQHIVLYRISRSSATPAS